MRHPAARRPRFISSRHGLTRGIRLAACTSSSRAGSEGVRTGAAARGNPRGSGCGSRRVPPDVTAVGAERSSSQRSSIRGTARERALERARGAGAGRLRHTQAGRYRAGAMRAAAGSRCGLHPRRAVGRQAAPGQAGNRRGAMTDRAIARQRFMSDTPRAVTPHDATGGGLCRCQHAWRRIIPAASTLVRGSPARPSPLPLQPLQLRGPLRSHRGMPAPGRRAGQPGP